MSASIFTDKAIEPNDMMLSQSLAEAQTLLNNIGTFIETKYGGFKPEWKFYNQKSGWIMKMFSLKRNVMFIIPCNEYFKAVFIFGDKATESIMQSNLPDTMKHDLLNAKKYAEGRSIQVDVKNRNDYENIEKLIQIKMEN